MGVWDDLGDIFTGVFRLPIDATSDALNWVDNLFSPTVIPGTAMPSTTAYFNGDCRDRQGRQDPGRRGLDRQEPLAGPSTKTTGR